MRLTNNPMKPNSNLQKVIRRIVEALTKEYQPERIILFGSYVSGKPRPDSDIDLLIIKETERPFFDRLTEVRRIASDARRGYPFDPLVMTPKELKTKLARGDQFFEEIMSTGSVLYARR